MSAPSMRIRVLHEGYAHDDVYDVQKIEIQDDVRVEITHYGSIILWAVESEPPPVDARSITRGAA